jgi:hypothetical protein
VVAATRVVAMVRLLNGVSRLLLLRLLPPLLLFCQQAEWAQAADPESRRESLEEVEVRPAIRRRTSHPTGTLRWPTFPWRT